MNKYLVEFLGTFFLVLTIGLVVPTAGNLAPLAIGAVLVCMIYAGGHVSGAHYNPAVTLAAVIRGRCSTAEAVPYVISQVVGALLAGMIVQLLLGIPDKTPDPLRSLTGALLAEILFTFALAFVILNVATAKGTAGNSHYGVAIGLAVVGGAYAVGGISRGVFNPAVAAGITLMGMAPPGEIWVYLIGNFLGGALGAYVFLIVNPEEK